MLKFKNTLPLEPFRPPAKYLKPQPHSIIDCALNIYIDIHFDF